MHSYCGRTCLLWSTVYVVGGGAGMCAQASLPLSPVILSGSEQTCRNHNSVLFKGYFSCGSCSYCKYKVPFSKLCSPCVGSLLHLTAPTTVQKMVCPRIIYPGAIIKIFYFCLLKPMQNLRKSFQLVWVERCWYIVCLYSMCNGNTDFLINYQTKLWGCWIGVCSGQLVDIKHSLAVLQGRRSCFQSRAISVWSTYILLAFESWWT